MPIQENIFNAVQVGLILEMLSHGQFLDISYGGKRYEIMFRYLAESKVGNKYMQAYKRDFASDDIHRRFSTYKISGIDLIDADDVEEFYMEEELEEPEWEFFS